MLKLFGGLMGSKKMYNAIECVMAVRGQPRFRYQSKSRMRFPAVLVINSNLGPVFHRF